MATKQIAKIAFEKCLEAVEPRFAVRNAIKLAPNVSELKIGDSTLPLVTSSENVKENSKVVIISFGKAALLMAQGARDLLKSPLLHKTFIIVPKQQQSSNIAKEFQRNGENQDEIFFGAKNNLPDEKSMFATKMIIRKIQKLDSPTTIFLFLISGGGSALLTYPRSPITLEEKLKTIKILQSHGATIQQLNKIRQKLSAVKGGKLVSQNVKHGRSIALLISDVIGNPMNLIASGPTVISNNDVGESVSDILETLNIKIEDFPESVKRVLIEKEESHTVSELSAKFENFIISSNEFALRSASEFLTSSGFNAFIVTSALNGNASEIGREFAKVVSGRPSELLFKNAPELENFEKHFENSEKVALLFGGETTVKLSENPGKGGRNQEMVLSFLDSLKSATPQFNFTFLSAGTDGQDGPTDAAGAFISNADLNIPCPTSSEFLENSDSYNFWIQFNHGKCHLRSGPTGTNVMDIQILLLDKLR